MTGIVPHVYYQGAFPTAPLTDATAGGFTVAVRVHFDSLAGASGTLTVTGNWPGATASQAVTLPAGNSSVTVNVTAAPGSVQLWWPARLGAQNLYTVSVSFTPSNGAAAMGDSRRIGFRVAHTITTDLSAGPGPYEGINGSGNFTMRFKINGCVMFAVTGYAARRLPGGWLRGPSRSSRFQTSATIIHACLSSTPYLFFAAPTSTRAAAT